MPLKWVLIFGRARVWTLKGNYLIYIITVSSSALYSLNRQTYKLELKL